MEGFDLAARLERLAIVDQVHNVIGRYALCHLNNDHAGCLALSAADTLGARAELPMGVYEGRAGLERLYLGFFGRMDAQPAGKMHLHSMTTPIVEVAGDLNSAKGVWISPGHATDNFGGDRFAASWRWVKYGCDFVPENGVWKIWHLKIFGIFATPFDKSWVDAQPRGAPKGPPPMPPEYAPDRAADPLWQYREDAAVPDAPLTPEPYRTFADTFSY